MQEDYEEHLRMRIRELIEEESAEKVADWQRRIVGMQSELDELKSSMSFKIGKLITFPFRKVKKIICAR